MQREDPGERVASHGASSPIAIPVRHPVFDLSEVVAGDWHSGDPFKTAFFNALSLTFPLGERLFIDSVRAFEDRLAPGPLSETVRSFIGQEAVHAREHQQLNEMLCAARGYDLEWLERPQRERIEWAKGNLSPFRWLAVTVALEHLTAILADGILTDPSWLEGAEPRMAALWRWHAVEETEHKAVTFDVYRAVGGWEHARAGALRLMTTQLARDVLRNMNRMLVSDGHRWDLAMWTRGLGFLLGPRGVLRGLRGQWKAFRAPDFHPWQHDNRALVAAWEREARDAAGRPSDAWTVPGGSRRAAGIDH